MVIQSIRFPNINICNEEALYLHRDGSLVLFDGFFNLFYLEKHHRYCDIEDLSLELKVSGVRNIRIMHDRKMIRELKADGRVSVQLPYAEYERGVFWFAVEPDDLSGGWSVEGHYEGNCSRNAVIEDSRDLDDTSQVELAVNICTYKREPYVVRNMKSLIEWKSAADIDGNAPEVAKHMHVFIVDNAKSLLTDKEFLEATRDVLENEYPGLIWVIPNANTGGTGGFSRGMIEAMNRRRELGLSHLLMMDDDAVFDPELFVRLYGFLSLLRPEYKDITVGGALMREDYPFIQHAGGEWYGQFKVHNDHLMTDMRDFDICTSDWMCGIGDEHRFYGAWWCCCYHMSAVTEENMPLPIFVHHDDIQFGLKQKEAGRGIVFLNGVCVWHQGFETVFPGVKQYYNMRNTLITAALFEPEYLLKNMKKWAIQRYIGMLISYRYGDCEFVYRGLMDFLAGRDWLLGTDPEALHKELMAAYKEICPFEKIDVEYGAGAGLTVEQLRNYYSRERFGAGLWKKATFNGWFLPGDYDFTVVTPLDSPWSTYRHKRVLLYEPGSGKGCMVSRSNKEFFKGIWRMIRMAAAIDAWKLKGGKW